MRILGIGILAIVFVALIMFTGYNVGHKRGVLDGWRKATGGVPLDGERIKKEWSKMAMQTHLQRLIERIFHR